MHHRHISGTRDAAPTMHNAHNPRMGEDDKRALSEIALHFVFFSLFFFSFFQFFFFILRFSFSFFSSANPIFDGSIDIMCIGQTQSNKHSDMKSEIEEAVACHKRINTLHTVIVVIQQAAIGCAAKANAGDGNRMNERRQQRRLSREKTSWGKIARETHFYDPHGHFRFLRFAHLFLPRRERISRSHSQLDRHYKI